MHIVSRVLLGIFVASLAACSGGGSEDNTARKHDHVWAAQTEALDKAKQMEDELNEAVKRNLTALDKQ